MTLDELRKEIDIEFEIMDKIIKELLMLNQDIAFREPTIREKTAGSAFVAQFYSGIENILKRIHYFKNIPIPKGENWHIEIFKRFCNPPYLSLPMLFDEELELLISPYRKFRHIVYHGYGFQIEWDRMREGIENIEKVYLKFKEKIEAYFTAMKNSKL